MTNQVTTMKCPLIKKCRTIKNSQSVIDAIKYQSEERGKIIDQLIEEGLKEKSLQNEENEI
jgi:hypothetical protein